MQPIYIDLHIHTSENANNLNTNYDIAELVGQIKKLNGDSPFMISLTDHNTINKSAYLKAQNLDLNLIIGVELHIQNRAEAKSYHCHIYFTNGYFITIVFTNNNCLGICHHWYCCIVAYHNHLLTPFYSFDRFC